MTAPDPRFPSRMARVDGCPSCVANYALPLEVSDIHPSGFEAAYCCEDCGHRWTTTWKDD